MSKYRIILALLLMVVIISSCGNNNVSSTGGNENETASESTYIGYPAEMLMTDSPTRLIFLSGYHIHYYNKLDGEIYPFCFDPLCGHSSSLDCLSMRFIMLGMGQTIKYSAYDNRCYILRGQKFCSVSFDGSDLRVDYSFGEEGDFSELGYSPFGVLNLEILGQYAYMLWIDSDTGYYKLMRYDMSSKKMSKIYEVSKQDEYFDYTIQGNQLLLKIGSKIYLSNYDATDLQEVKGHEEAFLKSIYNGEYYFEFATHYDEDGLMVYDGIVKYDPNTNTKERIYSNSGGNRILFYAVTADKLYFNVNEPLSIGAEVLRGEVFERFNYQSKVYCIDINTGECSIVFDDIQYSIEEIFFLEENKLFIKGAECVISSDKATNKAAVFTAEFDEDGNIVNMEKKRLNG